MQAFKQLRIWRCMIFEAAHVFKWTWSATVVLHGWAGYLLIRLDVLVSVEFTSSESCSEPSRKWLVLKECEFAKTIHKLGSGRSLSCSWLKQPIRFWRECGNLICLGYWVLEAITCRGRSWKTMSVARCIADHHSSNEQRKAGESPRLFIWHNCDLRNHSQ